MIGCSKDGPLTDLERVRLRIPLIVTDCRGSRTGPGGHVHVSGEAHSARATHGARSSASAVARTAAVSASADRAQHSRLRDRPVVTSMTARGWTAGDFLLRTPDVRH